MLAALRQKKQLANGQIEQDFIDLCVVVLKCPAN